MKTKRSMYDTSEASKAADPPGQTDVCVARKPSPACKLSIKRCRRVTVEKTFLNGSNFTMFSSEFNATVNTAIYSSTQSTAW